MGLFYYIGPYAKRGWGPDTVEADLFYAPPVGAIGSLDLRVDPSRDGNALFVFKDAYDAKGYVALNTGLDAAEEKLGDAQAIIRDMYGVELESGGTLLDGLWRLLTMHADGVNVPNPLMPTHKGVTELWLANTLVKAEPFKGKTDPAWEQVQRVLAANYTALRADATAKDGDTTLAQKWLGAMELKYRVPYTDIAPVALQDVAPIKPTTTLTESWPTDQAGLSTNQDLTWTETNGDWAVSGGQCVWQANGTGSLFASARAESDLSSDDHYAQFSAIAIGAASSDTALGPCVRFSSSALTFYGCYWLRSDGKFYLYKFVNDTGTSLATAVSLTPSFPDPIKIQADGSGIKAWWDGVEKFSITDSSITGNTRGGFLGISFSGTAPTLDDWEAADLVAAGGIVDLLNGKLGRPSLVA